MNEWFEAVEDGRDERVAELLAEQPDIIDLVDSDNATALHRAARRNHEKVVARLLAARPALVHARNCFRWTALDTAAVNGHDKIVAQLLAEGARVDGTSLYNACAGGYDEVVALLLKARPDLASVSTDHEETIQTLFYVATYGHEKVFAQLLAACPELVDATVDRGVTLLHRAARHGNDNMILQILALRPEMISVVDQEGWNALMYAVEGGHENTSEQLLAIKPELALQITSNSDTILHRMVERHFERQFVTKLWREWPEALTHANAEGRTPFYYAVLYEIDELLDLFQWTLSFDEIVATFEKCHATPLCHERYRPVIEQQCEPLFACLPRDVAGTVFEYLGFDPVLQCKRAKLA